jgi:hypothetical protein
MDRYFDPNNSNKLSKRPSLEEAIMMDTPKADPLIIKKLSNLCKKYNINWIPGGPGKGAFFVSNQLATAKGVDSRDFSNNWASNKVTISAQFQESTGKRPFVMKLKTQELRTFKDLWKHYIGGDLGRAPELYICEWPIAYWYLTRGRSDAATDFTLLGAEAINPIVLTTPVESLTYLSEEEIQTRIALLSTYSTRIKLTQEETLINTLDKTSKTRRFDLVERRGKKEVIIYELKRDVVTADHIKEILGERGYLDLAKKKYRGKKVRLVFISPNGIEESAKRMIRYNLAVSYMNVFKLIERIQRSILNQTNPAGHFKFIKDIFPKLAIPTSLDQSPKLLVAKV